jgi:hypothetical protein
VAEGYVASGSCDNDSKSKKLVRVPTTANINPSQLFINIIPGDYPANATCSLYPMRFGIFPVKVDQATPVAGETYGTQAGSCVLKKGNTGFICLGQFHEVPYMALVAITMTADVIAFAVATTDQADGKVMVQDGYVSGGAWHASGDAYEVNVCEDPD